MAGPQNHGAPPEQLHIPGEPGETVASTLKRLSRLLCLKTITFSYSKTDRQTLDRVACGRASLLRVDDQGQAASSPEECLPALQPPATAPLSSTAQGLWVPQGKLGTWRRRPTCLSALRGALRAHSPVGPQALIKHTGLQGDSLRPSAVPGQLWLPSLSSLRIN